MTSSSTSISSASYLKLTGFLDEACYVEPDVDFLLCVRFTPEGHMNITYCDVESGDLFFQNQVSEQTWRTEFVQKRIAPKIAMGAQKAASCLDSDEGPGVYKLQCHIVRPTDRGSSNGSSSSMTPVLCFTKIITSQNQQLI